MVRPAKAQSIRDEQERDTPQEHPAVHQFLASAGDIFEHHAGDVIYAQGDPCASIMYLEHGAVKMSVIARSGREAVVGILGAGTFLGEGCLVGEPVRKRQATAIMPSRIRVIDKADMLRALREEFSLSDRFIAHLLARNLRVEEDLLDQLFNATEQRLARTLWLLARGGKGSNATGTVPHLTQTTLAEIVGTTRSRVNHFMNQFRRRGLIEYTTDAVTVHAALESILTDVK